MSESEYLNSQKNSFGLLTILFFAVKNQIFLLAGDGITRNELIYGRPTEATTAVLGDGTKISELTDEALEITL